MHYLIDIMFIFIILQYYIIYITFIYYIIDIILIFITFMYYIIDIDIDLFRIWSRWWLDGGQSFSIHRCSVRLC